MAFPVAPVPKRGITCSLPVLLQPIRWKPTAWTHHWEEASSFPTALAGPGRTDHSLPGTHLASFPCVLSRGSCYWGAGVLPCPPLGLPLTRKAWVSPRKGTEQKAQSRSEPRPFPNLQADPWMSWPSGPEGGEVTDYPPSTPVITATVFLSFVRLFLSGHCCYIIGKKLSVEARCPGVQIPASVFTLCNHGHITALHPRIHL